MLLFLKIVTESTFLKALQNAPLKADHSGGKYQTAEFSYRKTCCLLDKQTTLNTKIIPHTQLKKKSITLSNNQQV